MAKKTRSSTPAKATSSITPRRRKLQAPKHTSFHLSKKLHRLQKKPIIGALSLLRQTYGLFRTNRKLFGGIIVIHLILNIVFVYGAGSLTSLADLKYDIQQALGDDLGSIGTSFALLGYLAGSLNVTDPASGVYQVTLTVITSLVLIWALRQVSAGQATRVKDAYYNSMYPLIPFLLVMVVTGLQLLPAVIGSFLYGTVSTNELAVTVVEKIIWLLIFGLLILLSLYMVLSSIFALYIVTLPEMTPMRALRSARGLVLHRRLSIVLRLLVLPIVLIGLFLVIMLPVVLIIPALAQVIFLLLSGFALFFIHGYLYNLYRALL